MHTKKLDTFSKQELQEYDLSASLLYFSIQNIKVDFFIPV